MVDVIIVIIISSRNTTRCSPNIYNDNHNNDDDDSHRYGILHPKSQPKYTQTTNQNITLSDQRSDRCGTINITHSL